MRGAPPPMYLVRGALPPPLGRRRKAPYGEGVEERVRIDYTAADTLRCENKRSCARMREMKP